MNYFNYLYKKNESVVLDESLEEHDNKYHPNGFDPEKQKCSKRDSLKAESEPDNFSNEDSEKNEPSKGSEVDEGRKNEETYSLSRLDIPDDVISRFLEFCRSTKGTATEKEIYSAADRVSKGYRNKNGTMQYYIVRGRRKGEFILQHYDGKGGMYHNPTTNVYSWRKTDMPRERSKPTFAKLVNSIADPIERQACSYFGGLLSVNPGYAKSPDRMVSFLKGYNGPREISEIRQFRGGEELASEFEKITKMQDNDAISEMSKLQHHLLDKKDMVEAALNRKGPRHRSLYMGDIYGY